MDNSSVDKVSEFTNINKRELIREDIKFADTRQLMKMWLTVAPPDNQPLFERKYSKGSYVWSCSNIGWL